MGNLVRLEFKNGSANWTCPPGVRRITCRTFNPNIGIAQSSSNVSCGISTQNSRAYFWGDNQFGQLGVGDILSRSTPTVVLGTVSQGAEYYIQSIPFLITTAANTWTYPSSGGEITLPPGDWEIGYFVSGLVTQTAVATAVYANVALAVGTSVVADSIAILTQQPVAGGTASIYPTSRAFRRTLTTTTTYRAAIRCSVATASGSLTLPGANVTGSLSTPDNSQFIWARRIGELHQPVSAITAVSGDTSGFISADGSVYMFGLGTSGQIGNGATNNASVPTLVSISNAKQIVGGQTPGVITDSGLLYRWGPNAYGQLGSMGILPQSTPVIVPSSGSLPWEFVSGMAVGQACIGLLSNGRVYTWGRNLNGVIGDNTLSNRSAPTLVTTLGVMASVFGGANATAAAIDTNGDAYAWGANSAGQLGDGTTQDRSTPTLIAGDIKWKWLALGDGVSAGISQNGDVYTWGDVSALGGSAAVSVSTPTLVTSLGGAQYITANGAGFTCYQQPPATKANIPVAAWGVNTYGQLGDGTTSSRTSPISVSNSGSLVGSQCVDYGTATIDTVPGTQYSISVTSAGVRFGASMVGPHILGPTSLYLEYFT